MSKLDRPNRITKSEFIRGLDCERRLWLDRFRADLRQPLSPPIRERMEVGSAIGKLAHQLYPDGVLVPTTYGDHDAGAALTQEMLDEGASCLFEATFIVGGHLVRVDVLSRGESGWILDEVKSSSVREPEKIDDDKVFDLAFQVSTLRQAGLKIEKARLVLVDTSWVWDGGDYDANFMLGVVNVTERCEHLQPQVADRAALLLATLESDSEPKVETNTHCKICDYFNHCHRERPYDVIHLPRISADAVRKIRAEGYWSIDEIPEDFKLTEPRRRMRDVVVSGSPHIGDGIGEALGAIQYPAFYVDYETSNPAFPTYPGTRPYQQICFQWSGHLVKTPESEPVHIEFLADGSGDPRGEFCRSLWEVVSQSQSIVYYTHFELTQLRAMERDGIPLASDLVKALEERTVDLEKIVREHLCYREFMGRTSLKIVLPVLVPSMSYREMLIADGNAAGWGFRRMLSTDDPSERETLRHALLDYCRQDTLAMVEIHRALSQLVQRI